jgi:surfeit locus 1 family protein
MKFKPTLLPTLFTVPAIIVLLVLGTWQVQRLQWKNNLMAAVNEKVVMPVMDLPLVVDNFDDLQYRKVRIKGHFLNDKEVHLFVGAKEFKGNMGYDIITPFKREDGSVVLVDRGWVPYAKKLSENRPETIINGTVEIEGMLHKGEVQKGFTPDNDVEKNLWYWIDVAEIEKHIGEKLPNLYVRVLKKDDSNMLPIGGDEVIRHRNDHLQYAITWYSFAVILLGIYIIYHRKGSAK